MSMTLNDEARAYFVDMGLTYADVYREDIRMLCSMLDVELRKVRYLRPLSGDEPQLEWNASRQRYYPALRGMGSAFITLRWAGAQREAISFNADGFIGFCGWASSANTLHVVEAFKDWCDLMAMRKQAIEINTGKVHA